MRIPMVLAAAALAATSLPAPISRSHGPAPKPAAAASTDGRPLQVRILGTGYPRPDPEHAGPSAVVMAGGRWFVVDAGRGVTMRIAGTELKYEAMRAVFLTHLHSDHTAGLPDLFITSWQFGRKTTPLALYGPSGTKQLAEAMLQFFAYDIHIRRDVVEKHPAAGATIVTHIVSEGVVYEDREVKVTAFAVDHRPIEPAFGYRFDSHGRSIVISGDTRPTPNLVKYARGADVLVMESYLPEWFEKIDKPDVAERLKHYHTSAEEAGRMAAAAGVKTLVLTHLIPANEEKKFAERAGRSFKGTIVVARDLQRINAGGGP
jgi:ribonuclease Z